MKSFLLMKRQRLEFGKRAAEHNVSATIRHFLKIYPDCPLKESTFRGWKNQYNHEVVRLKNSGKEVVVRELNEVAIVAG